MINAPLPEISHLLLPALSQENTLSGKCGTSFLNHSSVCRVSSDFTVMLPSWSTRTAPWLANIAPTQLTASLCVLIGMPNGYPALAHFSAAVRNRSQFHLSASSLSGGAAAGYILVTSSPTNCFTKSMRAQGVPAVPRMPVGTAIQWPFCLPRYSELGLTLPC